MIIINRFFLFLDSEEDFFAVSAENLREARRNARLIDRRAREFCAWDYTEEEILLVAERLGFEVHYFPICED